MGITVAAIKQSVSRAYGISVMDIESVRRTRAVVRPRQIAMYLARQMTTQSLPEIGRRFNNRDHTTVLHACRRVENAIKVEPGLADLLDQLAEQVTRQTAKETALRIEQLAELMAPIIAEKVMNGIAEKQVNSKAMCMKNSQEQKAFVGSSKPAIECDCLAIRKGNKNSEFYPPAIIKQPKPKASANMNDCVVAVVNAITKWESDKFSRGEHHALRRLEKACLELRWQYRMQISTFLAGKGKATKGKD